ncbi:MAG: hypothetical protein AB7H77_09945 [Bdellovibrionales bacterium]
MRRWLIPTLFLLAVAACGPTQIAEFWRPISQPNIDLPLEKAQHKLNFDLSQCRCGIYPTNLPRDEMHEFQPDKERLSETSMTISPTEDGQCMQRPSLVVAECMRGRGWEITNCSGRMPLAGGGSLCAAYEP